MWLYSFLLGRLPNQKSLGGRSGNFWGDFSRILGGRTGFWGLQALIFGAVLLTARRSLINSRRSTQQTLVGL